SRSIVRLTPKLITEGTPYSGVYSICSTDDQLLIGRTGSIQSVDPVSGEVISGNPPVPEGCKATNLSPNAQRQLWYTDFRGTGVRCISLDSISQGRKTPEVTFSNVMSVFVDRSNVIWFGMKSTGLYKYVRATNQFNPLYTPFTSQQKKYVNQVFEDIHGRLWVNNEILDRKTGSYSRPEFIPASDQFIYLEEDATGRLWGMTAPGKLWSYNTRINQEEWYDLGASVSIDGPIHSDKNGVLWWGLAGILHRFDPAQGDLRSYQYDPSARANKVGSFVFALVHDLEGLLWIATQQGLIRFDERSGIFKSFRNDPEDPNSLSANRVLSIHVDRRQPGRYLWLGTEGGGVNRLDRKDLTFDRWTTSDGLPDNTVYSVLEDKNNKLWMSTNRGLSRFDPDKNSFRNYDIGDGLQSNEFNRLAYFRSTSGELFFGGVFGLNAFYPEEIEDNPYLPPIAITGLRIGNNPVSVLDSVTPLKASISETNEIHLAAHQKMIALEYAALDYTNPGKNQYRYRLEGLQDDWIEARHNRIATFTNLDPGNYRFHVQGSNNDGLWNHSGASLRLVMHLPGGVHGGHTHFILLLLFSLWDFWAKYASSAYACKVNWSLNNVKHPAFGNWSS
ncbi:MAG: ligand-binding sensor domain-containing protein, partial [Owenweeksia sp.]